MKQYILESEGIINMLYVNKEKVEEGNNQDNNRS